MLKSSRMQDMAAVVLGVFTALSPMWVDTNNAARWTLIVLGVLIALAGLAHMMAPDMGMMADYAMGLFGALLFIAPWVMDYRGYDGAAWTSWIVGVLTVVAALAAMPAMNARMHRPGGLATHH